MADILSKKQKTVLIVEDDGLLRNILMTGLEQVGMRVFVASSAEEAKQAIAQETPSLVLLDILLPGQDGFSFLRELHEEPRTQNVPVVIISNLGSRADVEKGKSLGAVDYFIKAQISIDGLIEQVKRYFPNKD